MGEIIGGEFNWGTTEKVYEEGAAYEATVIHGDFTVDKEDPSTYEENVVVLRNLPLHEVMDRLAQIEEVVIDDVMPEAFPDSLYAEVTNITLFRGEPKPKFFKRVLGIAGKEIEDEIELADGATAIVRDTNQKVS
jgi:hypothetical protein